MPEQDPLAQLRDIHLPDAVGIWPPAPGWWMLAIILLAAIVYGCIRLLKYHRQQRYRRLALVQLATLEQQALDDGERLQQLNKLLKQTALAAYPRTDIASLSGPSWLQLLDRSISSQEFSQGVGKILSDGPYQGNTPDKKLTKAEFTQLTDLCRRWIKRHHREAFEH